MEIVEIGEPIRVLAVFSGGAVEPLRFFRHGRAYEIEAVNGRWIDRGENGQAGDSGESGDSGEGGGSGKKIASLHFSVQVGLETYYIHYAGSEVQWWLDQVIVE